VLDPRVAAVLDQQNLQASPAWAQLAVLLEARGMGWMARIEQDG
jgi:hypothetical protein